MVEEFDRLVVVAVDQGWAIAWSTSSGSQIGICLGEHEPEAADHVAASQAVADLADGQNADGVHFWKSKRRATEARRSAIQALWAMEES